MARKPPVDIWTEKEQEVALILLDVSSMMSQEPIRWGKKRRRTGPSYEFKPEPERPEPEPKPELPSTSNEEKGKQEETPTTTTTTTTSPVTPLCFPNSGSSEEIQEKIVPTPPPLKPTKKSNCQRERLKEKREAVAALTKENADLTRELQQLQEKLRQLNAEKLQLQLQDKNFKLCAAQVGVGDLNQLKPVGPTPATNWTPFVVTQQWVPPPPPLYQPAIERPGLELDLNVKLADDVADGGEAAVLTCQPDREELAAMSAMARKRRLEIQRERRGLASSAQKRPRVR